MWNIAETRSHIDRRFGRSQLMLAMPSIASLPARLDYARYHYAEVRRLLTSFATAHLQTKPLLVVTLGKTRDREKFELFMTKSGAHAVACIQSIHSIPDLLGHAIYFSLGLNRRPKPLDERAVYAAAVIDVLRKEAKYDSLRVTVSKLCDDHSFKHVAALSNLAKHRGIVKSNLNEDWTGARKDRHEVRFDAFHYAGKPFPEAKIVDVLDPAYEIASRSVVDAGIEVNRLFNVGAI